MIAPYGFMQEVLSENVIAGNAMSRRASYHFGFLLQPKADGTEAYPLSTAGLGSTTLIAPTVELPEGRGQITTRTVDGVEI